MSWLDISFKIINKEDKNYPNSLLTLRQPPKQLYCRGGLSAASSIAIVGSRRMTRYGALVVDKFVSAFALAGVTTVSGYMYGVDSEVHNKTTEYGGRTVAVMGGGIDRPYPPENDKLYTKILQCGGAVLSEYEPSKKPKLWMYPQRNRIVAALATMGILVIEAGIKSGSLITVDYARKLNKKIYAVPGPVTSSVSDGTNYLIKKGLAKLVTGPEDILGRVKEQESEKVKVDTKLNPPERDIYDLLKNEEMSIDEIAMALDENMIKVSSTVSMLALRGLISEAGGKYFVV